MGWIQATMNLGAGEETRFFCFHQFLAESQGSFFSCECSPQTTVVLTKPMSLPPKVTDVPMWLAGADISEFSRQYLEIMLDF